MNLDVNSVTNFSAVDPDLWEVTFTGEVDTWTMPVIGFAAVIVNHQDDAPSDARLYPVVLDDSGFPLPVFEYLQDWDAPRPTFKLHRKGAHRDTCPACGKASVYAATLDRHVHADGSDNQPCWRSITRGEG